MLRGLSISIVFLLAVVPLVPADENALDRERKALQGVWIVDAAYRDGEKVPDNERMTGAVLHAIQVKEDRCSIAFEKKGDEFRFSDDSFSFSLDLSVNPKIIEFEAGPNEKFYCIYSIKDGQLTLAFNYADGPLGSATKDRTRLPKKLETKRGDGTYMFVLKQKD